MTIILMKMTKRTIREQIKLQLTHWTSYTYWKFYISMHCANVVDHIVVVISQTLAKYIKLYHSCCSSLKKYFKYLQWLEVAEIS